MVAVIFRIAESADEQQKAALHQLLSPLSLFTTPNKHVEGFTKRIINTILNPSASNHDDDDDSSSSDESDDDSSDDGDE